MDSRDRGFAVAPRPREEYPLRLQTHARSARRPVLHVNGQRLELSVDLYNATNANTIFGVRTNTGPASIRVNGDPSAPITQIAAFMSPTQVLAPRVLRLNVTFAFGRR